MDISLARTFLEIAATGSFVAAADRLNITQTAVSARVRALEDHLGRRLFVRNKSGARLTSAGERFMPHATSLVQVWDRARQQVGLPEGRTDVAYVGAESSLWNPLLTDWLVWMKSSAPQVALRADVDVSARLLERIQNGSMDVAILYEPPPQGGSAVAELLLEEKLVLATTEANSEAFKDYIQVEWEQPFLSTHQSAIPGLPHPDITITHGPLALTYMLRAGGAGYFRLSALQPFIERGLLRLVPSAPEFSYSVHMVYSAHQENGVVDLMRQGFRAVAPKSGYPALE